MDGTNKTDVYPMKVGTHQWGVGGPGCHRFRYANAPMMGLYDK